MKFWRMLAVVCLTSVVAAPANAQQHAFGGIVGGFTSSSLQLTGADVSKLSTPWKPGFLVGGFGVFPIVSIIGVQPGVSWSAMRFTIDDPNSAFNAHEDWAFVEVPVLLRIGRKVGGHVVIGPAARVVEKATEDLRSGPTGADVKSKLQTSDVSLVVGAGYASRQLGIEVRYDGGLKDLNNGLVAAGNTIKARSVQLLVTFTP